MKFVNTLVILFVILVSNGCATYKWNLTLTDFQQGDVLEGTMYRKDKAMNVTMPDGEVLQGKWFARFSDSSNVSFGIGTAYSGTTTTTGHGIGISSGGSTTVYALLKSHNSNRMMEVNIIVDRMITGVGEGQTNDGRRFKVQMVPGD